MARPPENHGAAWTPEQVKQLRVEVKQNTPTRVLGLHLGRTPEAVQAKASELGVSLKPTNQRPYGTKK
ncbi:MAG: hypothetical protein QOK17_1391 [Sphingomonadales bacterium]|jgi:hypothetical protein|nr:hypothetical protein [Sphingomonadales bacterium]